MGFGVGLDEIAGGTEIVSSAAASPTVVLLFFFFAAIAAGEMIVAVGDMQSMFYRGVEGIVPLLTVENKVQGARCFLKTPDPAKLA